ncbi:hypothetical protein C1J03_23890 (plasmid) [Sulfitobacter sp. SK012]|uniref:hypothetical protein n=1 Tax=Sulfitobacter sp. SK012 TaxID=1389005 RepID=UPI000E0CB886|nr:hypothetical protein [Sulfitobacter sp. SK012]AXI49153.1 hypothetical protein C1J03_23890 [Sulfitobacter sp. SK012]
MTVVLDKVVQIGPRQITALSECTVIATNCRATALVAGQKRPVAILIKQGMELTAFEPDGTPITRKQVETLCPGAWRKALELG